MALFSPAGPPNTTTSQSSRALEKRAEENTWVSTWTGKQLVETRVRVKRSRRAMECHGGRLMECHDDRKRRSRESNVALQDLEKTALSTPSAQRRGESVVLGDHQTTHSTCSKNDQTG